MIKLKDDNDAAVLRELSDDEMLADASNLIDSSRASIVNATWKTASAWQALVNRIGECEVITLDGIARGFIWPDRPVQQAEDVAQKTKHPLWGEPKKTGSCA